jgi:D-alanyl-D-alanine carboxypeptidase
MKKTIYLHVLLSLFFGLADAQPFDPTLASILQNKIDSMRTANNVKGISAGVFYPGMGTWQGVSGISHPGVPITPDMEFAIASNTKLFTAVLLLKLAENNIINIDDSLYHYLQPFNNIDTNITIRQLLNHTSGLADVISVPGYPDSVLSDPYRVYTAAELMTWAGPPSFAPGTGWEYCNTNYLLAGMIAESATGLPYGRLLRDSILTPLQLDSTFLDVYDSVLYTIAHPWQGGVDNNATPRVALNSAAGAAGAMYSTSGEMLQWYHALMNGQVLNTNSLNEMTTFVGSGNYGMGISEATIAGRTVWLHGGLIWGGYNSSMMYDTTTGVIVCVLTNQLPATAFQVAAQLLVASVNSTVGISENTTKSQRVTIRPNPARDLVHVEVPHQNISSITVISPSGRVLKELNETSFSVSDLPEGLYFLIAETDEGVGFGKMVKR